MIALKTPGMRTIKTALIVALGLLVSKLLNLQYPYYVAITGIICTQNTLHASFSMAKNRILGTLIGATLGILFVYMFSYNPWSSGMGIILLLYFLNLIKLNDAFRVSCIVYLATFVPGHGPAIAYGVDRTIATVIGILLALIVNKLVSPRQYSEDIKKLSYDLVESLFKSCGDEFIFDKNMNLSIIGMKIVNIEELISNYKLDVDRGKIKTIDIEKLEKLIVKIKSAYNHLGIIEELRRTNSSLSLDEENRLELSDIYDYEIHIKTSNKSYADDVFNYHVRELSKYLREFKGVIENL